MSAVWPWALGAAGLALALLGWQIEPLTFRHAWLAALTVWLEIPLGALALLLVHALTGGSWGYLLRPALLGCLATLPLLLPAAVPLVAHLHALYPWARAGANLPNGFYLNTPFFAVRGGLYLILWFGLGALTVRALRRGDDLRRIAPAGLIVLAITVTFAAIDTTLSLAPQFNSSVWGMIALAATALQALSMAVLVTVAGERPELSRDFGRLLLGLVVLWAYLTFMQFLIVWESDLAPGAAWYSARAQGVWGLVAGVLGVGHFLVPFAVLVFPAAQRSRWAIMAVCGWLIAMEVLRVWWVVLPAQPRAPSWLDLAALLAFAGFGVALARRAPVAAATYV